MSSPQWYPSPRARAEGSGEGPCRVMVSVEGRLRARGKEEKLGEVSPRPWRIRRTLLIEDGEDVAGWIMGCKMEGRSEGEGRVGMVLLR